MAEKKEQQPVGGSELQSSMKLWYTEMHGDHSGSIYRVDKILESRESKFQRIDVFESPKLGKTLALYGSLMAADGDYNAYNESLAHTPLFVHANPQEVLIIGGGDCGCLTNVLKHPEVKRCTMCELDKEVVEASKRHFPRLTKGLADKRAHVVFQDGKKFLATTKKKFDVIILDLSDPIGPAADLFREKFHKRVFDCLKEDGILVAQSESPYYNQTIIKAMYANLSKIFPIVRMYTCHMVIYPSALWSFAFCSKKYHPLDDFDYERYKKLARQMKNEYYNDDIHFGSFALPEYVKKLAPKKG
ncbi:MAG TPA: polyamine aminopropyltransferase [candidate division Zixibacteria bacterium]|nr:polyamine aminopropyltransferase [candidate division Zixibacteria bacterium]